MEHHRVAAVIPAAGTSGRFERGNKLLEAMGDGTVLESTVRSALACGFGDVVVVTGFERERIEAALVASAARTVFNPKFEEGMGTSIAAGVGAARDAEAYAIWPADMPSISNESVRAVLSRAAPGAIVLPTRGGRRGHPVVFSARYRDELLALGGDRGARAILERHATAVVEIEVGDASIFEDLDTVEALEKARNRVHRPPISAN